MTETILTEPRYSKLVADIRRLIQEGQSKAATAANRLLLQSYWQIPASALAKRAFWRTPATVTRYWRTFLKNWTLMSLH